MSAITDRLGARPVFASPRAAFRSATPHLGYAWFPLAFDARGQLLGAGTSEADHAAAAQVDAGASAAADALVHWLDALEVQPAAVGLVGFSQGGIVAAQALRRHADRFAAVALLSSMVAPGELPGDAALARRRPPVFHGHGLADPVIPMRAVEFTRAWLATHAEVTSSFEATLGHEVSNAQLAALAAFLETHLPA